MEKDYITKNLIDLKEAVAIHTALQKVMNDKIDRVLVKIEKHDERITENKECINYLKTNFKIIGSVFVLVASIVTGIITKFF